MKKKTKKVTKPKAAIHVLASCQNYDITLDAHIYPSGITKDEVKHVKRVITHHLTTAISKLPFSQVYPFEVQVR